MSELPRTTIKGYDLAERIGAGGYGVVYRARQRAVDRDVAVKVILPALANEPEFIRRFEIEAQTIARLEHPHITPLYDYWRDPDGACLVMRYYPHGSLEDALHAGPWPLERTAILLDELASALAYAHRNGVVHRDIKASNVLLDGDGRAYLSDFGIAKSVADRSLDVLLTRSEGEGVHASLAPERATGSEWTQASDVYSLGVLLYSVLQGREPFYRDTPVARLIKQMNDALPPVEGRSEPAMEAVDAVIAKATARDPADRYPSAPKLAAAFRAAVGMPGEREPAPDAPLQDAGESGTTHVYPPAEGSGGATVGAANPYKGLRAFRVADAGDFHGREALVRTLVERMSTGGEDGRMLALVGPSGSGKSSVLHAGLIPSVRRSDIPGSGEWFVVDMVPGAHPFDELEIALTRIAVGSVSGIREHLDRDERGLVRAAQLALPADQGDVLIAIDQFEELFTLVDDEDTRRRFLDLLRAAVTAPRGRVRVVLTLRADFFDRPLRYPGFAELIRDRIETIVPMTAEELERAIVAPARGAGLAFEEGLVARIVHDVHDQPGALPLLQYALTELVEERGGALLTREAYERVGGVAGAIASRAEQVFRGLSPEDQAVTRQVFLRLVSLGEGTEDTRRRAERSELRAMTSRPSRVDDVIDLFAQHRLLSLDHDPGTREPTVELAHEAILREWSRLGAWISEARYDIRMQRQLSRLSSDWLPSGRDPSFLLRGTRLDQYLGWRREANVALTGTEDAFLTASQRQREEEAEAEAERQRRAQALQRRSQRFLQALVGVMLVATLVAGSLGLWADRQRRLAQEQQELAEQQTQIAEEQRAAAEAERSRAEDAELSSRIQAGTLLASQAEAEARDGNADLGILLALEALESFPYVSQAERALANAVSLNHALQAFREHGHAAAGAAWSPDGSLVATASQDNVVHVWDPTTAELIRTLEQPVGISRNVYDFALATAWSNDGEELYVLVGDRFLLGSQDYHLVRWDAASGERMSLVELPNEAIPEEGEGSIVSARKYWTGNGVAVGPETGRLASLAGDDTAAVWSPDLTERLLTLEGHENDVNSVAWSSDESMLLTSSLDFTARIWHGETGQSLRTLRGHENQVHAAVFSPDDARVATASADGTIRIWSVLQPGDPRVIDLAPGTPETLAWAPDGSVLIAGLGDTRVRLIDPANGEVLASLGGHAGHVGHVAMSPSGDRFVSSALDGVARVWSTRPATMVGDLPLIGIGNMAWTHDGETLVIPYGNLDSSIPGSDAGLALWSMGEKDFTTLNLDHSTRTHFWHAEAQPGGDHIMSLGVDTFPDSLFAGAPTAIHEIDTGDIVLERLGSDDTTPRSVEWAPSGDRFATSSIGGTIDVWAFPTGEHLGSALNPGDVWVGDVSWSPDGSVLATGDDGGWIRTWDAETLEMLAEAQADTVYVWSIEWSPDGSQLISTTGAGEGIGGLGGSFKVWEPESLDLLYHGTQHAGDVTWVKWSPDGSRFATIGVDDTMRVWDAETYAELMQLSADVSFFGHVAWSPDGDHLAFGSIGGRVVRVWESTDELVEYVRDCCVFRELTEAERERFALGAE